MLLTVYINPSLCPINATRAPLIRSLVTVTLIIEESGDQFPRLCARGEYEIDGSTGDFNGILIPSIGASNFALSSSLVKV